MDCTYDERETRVSPPQAELNIPIYQSRSNFNYKDMKLILKKGEWIRHREEETILDIKGKWKTALGQETALVTQPA